MRSPFMIVLVRSGRPARAGDGLRVRPPGWRAPGRPSIAETASRRAPRIMGQAVAQDDVEEQDEQLDVDEEQVDPNTVSE